MLNSWYSSFLLALESSDVIQFRIQMLAKGGEAAVDEAKLMVSEKIQANMEAMATLFCGGTPDLVIERYRERVASNAARLSELAATI